ncbi:branched-chain amino acid ABC transporter permease [Pelomonas sp. KK5]|uniref:branched-chain amino acid ABC transporter permease n=1 Tax=Pelomonas sp. KK5 TaxID=1855730 RepID=UPI00097C44C1|nr:branched-chain amino acid ABC transporter permease [Pelomonas sp. KK5]
MNSTTMARPAPAPRVPMPALLIAALALLPFIADATGHAFWLAPASRMLVFALAALGLNLILGHGAMVSMGHALYIGIGAYAVGILAAHGVTSALVQPAAALAAGAVVATLTGLVCLRASGVAFIMITLAFAQMFHYLATGLKAYGGDEGLPIELPGLDPAVLYWVILALVAASLLGMHRLVNSRFGMLLRGCRSNERRMKALGFPTLRYRLAAYVISALACVVAGMLLAHVTRFASPSYVHWTVSGDLIAMIVLGGTGRLIGPVIGAAGWVLLQELLAASPWPPLAEHWPLLFGLGIVVMVLRRKGEPA